MHCFDQVLDQFLDGTVAIVPKIGILSGKHRLVMCVKVDFKSVPAVPLLSPLKGSNHCTCSDGFLSGYERLPHCASAAS